MKMIALVLWFLIFIVGYYSYVGYLYAQGDVTTATILLVIGIVADAFFLLRRK